MRYFLRHIAHMPMSVAFLLLVCALGMWGVDYARLPEQGLTVLITQLLTLLNAGLLCSVLYRAKAAQHFSLVPALLYILTIAVFPYLRVHWHPQVLALLRLFFLFLTRDMSDDNEPNGILFFVTILLSITAAFAPDALWCIMYLWIVVLVLDCFSLRTVLASLLAVGLCAIYYFFAVYLGWIQLNDWSVLIQRTWFAQLLQPAVITVVFILLAGFLMVSGATFRRSSYDLVSTRMLLYHIVMLGLFATPLVLMAAPEPNFLALLVLSIAGTTGIFLLQIESESRGITLLLYGIVSVALYMWLLFTL